MDGKRVRAVVCGSTHTACLVTRALVSDDLIKNCMACKTKFSLVNRKVRVFIFIFKYFELSVNSKGLFIWMWGAPGR